MTERQQASDSGGSAAGAAPSAERTTLGAVTGASLRQAVAAAAVAVAVVSALSRLSQLLSALAVFPIAQHRPRGSPPASSSLCHLSGSESPCWHHVAQAPTKTRALRVGDWVEIHGCQGRRFQKLNGRTGTISHHLKDSGKWEVKLDHDEPGHTRARRQVQLYPLPCRGDRTACWQVYEFGHPQDTHHTLKKTPLRGGEGGRYGLDGRCASPSTMATLDTLHLHLDLDGRLRPRMGGCT